MRAPLAVALLLLTVLPAPTALAEVPLSPVAAGDAWTIRGKDFTKEVVIEKVEDDVVHERATTVTDAGGSSHHEREYRASDRALLRALVITTFPDGRRSYFEETYDAPCRVDAFPLVEGVTTTSTCAGSFRVNENESFTRRFHQNKTSTVGPVETIETPAGTFQATRVDRKWDSGTPEVAWYAPEACTFVKELLGPQPGGSVLEVTEASCAAGDALAQNGRPLLECKKVQLGRGHYVITYEASDPDGDALFLQVWAVDSRTVVATRPNAAAFTTVEPYTGEGKYFLTVTDAVHKVEAGCPALSLGEPPVVVCKKVTVGAAATTVEYEASDPEGKPVRLTFEDLTQGVGVVQAKPLVVEDAQESSDIALDPGVRTVRITATDADGMTTTVDCPQGVDADVAEQVEEPGPGVALVAVAALLASLVLRARKR